MNWQNQLKADPLPWLLDCGEPTVRYLALRHLLDLPEDDPELQATRRQAHAQGPIAAILDAMQPEGYWVEPGSGYYPKYQGSVWSLITLAQLGASIELDERLRRACDYLIEHALTPDGQFSVNGPPSGTVDCLQGNLCASLLDLGLNESRLYPAFEWMARTVTGEGLAPLEDKEASLRYYAGKCGPRFACGANNKLPCAWGGVKVMLAFGKLSVSGRTPLIRDSIQAGADFIFGVDPVTAAYPAGWSDKPSRNWWKFGFPVFYVTDLLQLAEVMVNLGYGDDPRLASTLAMIRDKQDKDGRWALEYDYAGKTWYDYGPKKQPNPYVTLRAVKVLKAAWH
jgi:hypothetical protein